jgi:pimeloyl-ACP methyl ester carboxylesterase
MGGWLMLLIAEALGERLAGLVGIAAAPDFAVWGFTPEQKGRLVAGETVYEDNPYGPEPTPTHAAFWQDAMEHLRLNRVIAVSAPVRLLHGQRDEDVPWQISMQLAEKLRSDDIQIALIKDGDHRLSREPDIALLLRQVWSLLD